MHYANDNAVVKAIYDFTHGPQRGLFVGIVVALALVSLYFPVRDLYVAKRSSDILAKQVEIREQYNDDLQKSVDKLLSEEGIKDAASEDLGLSTLFCSPSLYCWRISTCLAKISLERFATYRTRTGKYRLTSTRATTMPINSPR